MDVESSDGSQLAGFRTEDLEDCVWCPGKTFPGHECG
jgi:hypothetical protein